MAEAHQAVAFSFSITHVGWDINYDREVLNLVWDSGIRSWKKRIGRLRVSSIHFKVLGADQVYKSYFTSILEIKTYFFKLNYFIWNYRIAFEMELIQHICKACGSLYR